jgi:cytoskeletal protein CcmA (bactofilin family)
MRFRSEALSAGLVVLAVVVPSLPAAAEALQSDYVLVREEDSIAEDLYAAGNRVEIDGRVDGDLVAAAFEEVRIDGAVTGSVVAVAATVVIAGEVGGSVRVAARRVVVEGTVGGDLLVGAWSVDLTSGSAVGRDLLGAAWAARSDAEVGRRVEGQIRSLTLGGAISDDVTVAVRRLVVLDGTRVGGDLAYRSAGEAEVGDAAIEGSLIHERPLPPNVRLRGIRLLAFVLATIGSLVLGLVVIWAAPDRAQLMAASTRAHPFRSLGWGAGLAAVPVGLTLAAGLIVGWSPPEAGIPLLVVLGPLVAAAFSLLLLGLVLAPVPVASAAGRLLGRPRSLYAAFVRGYLVLAALLAVPVLRWVVLVGVGLVGLGAWLAGSEHEEPPVLA